MRDGIFQLEEPRVIRFGSNPVLCFNQFETPFPHLQSEGAGLDNIQGYTCKIL